jgi:6-phosphogluconolactonase
MGSFKLTAFADSRSLAEAAASAWLEEIAAKRGGPLCVALSGGRIAKAFFAVVTAQAKADKELFSGVDFFWGDERCVPPGDAESNYRVARESLLAPLEIADERVHRIRGELPPDQAATDAEAQIRQFVPLSSSGQPVLDLIFLGMGEDGHVASLFPGETAEVWSKPAIYRAVTATKPPPKRVTLGYATIVQAQQVWVLASGPGKQAALRESLRPDGQTPLARVIQSRSHTSIFSDIPIG